MSERAPAPRKPYRISKPREKWTEKEHEKFVKAINEHGRNWKRIVQEVGTRSVAQVRSHAQKYFLKLEKSGDAAEVPPARAKRPSAKPYPVKSTPNGSRSSQSSGPDRKRPRRAATDRSSRESRQLSFMPQESPPISTDGGTEDSVALLLTDAEGNGSNGDASGSNGQSNSAQDNSGLSTADLDYANCFSVPSASGRLIPNTNNLMLQPQPSTTERSDPTNDASSGQQDDPAAPPTSYGELYDVVGKLFGNTNTTNRQMLEQLGPSQREELALMMDQLTGEVRDSVGSMPMSRLDAQSLPSFSESLAGPSFSDTIGYPVGMPSGSLPLSLSLADPMTQRQSDLTPALTSSTLGSPSLGQPIEPLPDVPVTQANTSGTGLLPSCTHAGSDELIEPAWRMNSTEVLWQPPVIPTDPDFQLQPLIDTKIFDY